MFGRRSLRIQSAGPEAASLFAALHGAAFEEAWSERSFTAFLHLTGVTGLLAWWREAPVGFAVVRVAVDEAELLTIGVQPAARGRGAARALLKAASEAALAGGARVLHLEVAVGNVRALKLYNRAGFLTVGRRAGYYANGEDALACQLPLRPEAAGDAARQSA